MRAVVALLAALIALMGVGAAHTAGNSVPGGSLGGSSFAITPNGLKPPSCSGITLTTLRTGSGTFSGTSGADLVLGSAGVDTISAGGGNDCVLGGGGNDAINGGTGTDVCIGGPGTDTFTNCETAIQ